MERAERCVTEKDVEAQAPETGWLGPTGGIAYPKAKVPDRFMDVR